MTEPTGFRRDIMFLHDLSELMEKNQSIPKPSVELGKNWEGGVPVVSWYLSVDWTITLSYDYLSDDYNTIQEQIKELRRVDLEQRMAAVIDAFGPGVEWEGNDPTKDAYYYRLTTEWNGAKIRLSTSRDDVCEKVEIEIGEHEEEQPDPELHETFLKAVPKVKVMVKDTITEWQCNTALANKIHGAEVAA